MAIIKSNEAITKLLTCYGAQPATNSQVEMFQEHIGQQPGGTEMLEFLEKHTQNLDKMQLKPLMFSAFKKSRAALGGYFTLGVGGGVSVDVPTLGKDFTGGFLGIIVAPPFNGIVGTLYYDDESQINGAYDIQIGTVGPWYALNFFRDNQCKMTFQAASTPGIGLAGGKGKWL